jgi:hypothetical protein
MKYIISLKHFSFSDVRSLHYYIKTYNKLCKILNIEEYVDDRGWTAEQFEPADDKRFDDADGVVYENE